MINRSIDTTISEIQHNIIILTNIVNRCNEDSLHHEKNTQMCLYNSQFTNIL